MNKDGRNDVRQYSLRSRIVIGVLLTACLFSILVLYADCFRFVIELAALTIMGAMLNFSSAGKIFMVAVFVYLYSVQVFSNVTAKYQTLANELFDNFKSHFESVVTPVVNLKGSEQPNIAFKFFSKEELEELAETRATNNAEDPLQNESETTATTPNTDRLIIHPDGNLY